METKVLPVNEESLKLAAELLQNGEVVAIPTETVYGLAANAKDGTAVEKIFHVKGRPQDNPLIVHISTTEEIYTVAKDVPKSAMKLAQAFWPGPLSMVLPKSDELASSVSAGLSTVGVRLPAHAAARNVIAMAGVPLAAPSANTSGAPSPTSAKHVYQDLQGLIPLILDGGSCPLGVESTVLSVEDEPVVLRPGFVTPQEISDVLGCKVHLAPSLQSALKQGETPKSPGMKYKHYSPKAEITILKTDDVKNFSDYVALQLEKVASPVNVMCFTGEEDVFSVPCVTYGKKDDAASQARGLFSALRKLDKLGAKTVFARAPKDDGIGLAVRNRLLRAAAFREIVI